MFGVAPIPEWQTDVGSVLIARKDKRPITTKQVEAMSQFCREHLVKFAELYKSEGKLADIEEELKAKMTPNYFKEWFAGFRDAKVLDGKADWEGLEWPAEDE